MFVSFQSKPEIQFLYKNCLAVITGIYYEYFKFEICKNWYLLEEIIKKYYLIVGRFPKTRTVLFSLKCLLHTNVKKFDCKIWILNVSFQEFGDRNGPGVHISIH
jgi:hypothetical protein